MKNRIPTLPTPAPSTPAPSTPAPSTLRHFRCPEYAATLTPTSCASRYAASSRAHRPGGESAWRLTACRTCSIGKAHAAGRDARGVVYTERLVQLTTKPRVAPTSEPITAGAPVPDVAQQARESKRASTRARSVRSHVCNGRIYEGTDWATVLAHVTAWREADPTATRKSFYERAVAELGVSVSRARFNEMTSRHLGVDARYAAVADAFIEEMRPHVMAQPERGWRWHHKRLEAAGQTASSARIRRALYLLRRERQAERLAERSKVGAEAEGRAA